MASGGSDIYEVLGVIADLDDELTELSTKDARKERFEKHLQQMKKIGFKVKDFETGNICSIFCVNHNLQIY